MPRLDVPVIMVQGRLDQVAPGEPAQRFHDALTAPSKRLVWFEKSAHSPHLEEPDRFRALLRDLRPVTAPGSSRRGPLPCRRSRRV
jgi:pimeloyl-ACP methyl ester carboxylesterase